MLDLKFWRETGGGRGNRRRESGDERVRLTPLSLGHGAFSMFRSHVLALVRLCDSMAGVWPPVASMASPAVSQAAVRPLFSLLHLTDLMELTGIHNFVFLKAFKGKGRSPDLCQFERDLK